MRAAPASSRRPDASGRRRAPAEPACAPPRVRAEELHPTLLGVETAQGVGDQLVGDVPFGIDHEAVVAETAGLRRAALQLAQVDATGGELLQDGDQAARHVGALEDDHGRLVVPGWRRDGVAGDDDEARRWPPVSAMSSASTASPYSSPATRGAIAAQPPSSASLTVRAASAVEFAACSSTPESRWWRKRVHRRGDRDREHDLDVVEPGPRPAEQAVLDVEHDLPLDEQVVGEDQPVL